jgi:azurin
MKTTIKLASAALLTALAPLSTVPALRAADASPPTNAANDEKLVVIVANDTLKFSVTKIEAAPGQKIHVQLRNEGTLPKDGMGHNWILLDADSAASSYAMTALSDRRDQYEPKSMASHVLASIPLLGPKEVGDVTFCAPTKPGTYPFICSCSGHSMAGMRGELVVK